ncbi:MAG: DUF4159 domain-containing protein [Planctomycetota bacterium]
MTWLTQTRWFRYRLGIALLLIAITTVAVAQDYQRRQGRQRRGSATRFYDRNGVPEWEKNLDFEHDVFTFVRIQYDSFAGQYGYGPRDKWRIDYPDADLNLSYRLKQLTSLEVDPNGKIMRLTDPELFDYPFIYIIEPGMLVFSEDEVIALRRYLLKGGFLMVDDFWGEYEWDNFANQMKRVFPDRPWREVPLEHEIFHIVYDLKVKPLIPSVHYYMQGMRTERYDAEDAHYRAFFDDNDRIMAFICHNTDLGDGWEREGVDRGYFEKYSEPYAYPLGINIVTYAMTH